ncbi:MAG: hypothetical protein GC145_13680 [Caulobacter sp.]|nr:hypothetical protein [Caulobacter sp.]
MKHAGPAALDRLEPLLARLRGLPALKEKARGVFYRRGRAFLHFHEDVSGLHADLRTAGPDFDRFRVQDEAEREALFALILESLD